MTPERLRQIAILVDSLETPQADRLLEQFPEAVQQQVRAAVFSLPAISDEERRHVIQDFVQGQRTGASGVPSSTDSDEPTHQTGTYGDPRAQRRDRQPAAGGNEVPEYQKYINRVIERPENNAHRVSAAANSPKPETPQRHLNNQIPVQDNIVDALSQADLETLAAVVMKESPQVVAVVLSMLPAQRSAQLLELFPRQQQLESLRRLTDLGEVDDQVLDYLQQQLNQIVRRRVTLKRTQRSGPQALAAILSAAHQMQATDVVQSIHQQMQAPTATSHHSGSPTQWQGTATLPPDQNIRSAPESGPQSTASEWLQHQANNRESTVSAQAPAIANSDLRPELPEQQVQTPPTQQDPEERLASAEANQVDAFADVPVRFEFSRLAACDRNSLEALLATAKPKLTLLALRGATPKLLTRVLRLLPSQEAKDVEYRIQNLGPVRLQDIEEAQNFLLRLASVLEDMGRFRRPRKGLLSF